MSEMITDGSHLVVAQYSEGLDGVLPSLFPDRHLKVFGPYTPTADLPSHEGQMKDVLRQFMEAHADSPRDAQRFYSKIQVIRVSNILEHSLKDTFGEMLRFPNPKIFSEVDYYFLDGGR